MTRSFSIKGKHFGIFATPFWRRKRASNQTVDFNFSDLGKQISGMSRINKMQQSSTKNSEAVAQSRIYLGN